MDTLECGGKDFEVISLVNSEPVKVLMVLGYMRAGMRIFSLFSPFSLFEARKIVNFVLFSPFLVILTHFSLFYSISVFLMMHCSHP